MASCPGRRDNHSCSSTLYKCKKCGNVGCDQSSDGKCTNQGFKSGKCTKCGNYGKDSFR
jgi:hypothetical protein